MVVPVLYGPMCRTTTPSGSRLTGGRRSGGRRAGAAAARTATRCCPGTRDADGSPHAAGPARRCGSGPWGRPGSAALPAISTRPSSTLTTTAPASSIETDAWSSAGRPRTVRSTRSATRGTWTKGWASARRSALRRVSPGSGAASAGLLVCTGDRLAQSVLTAAGCAKLRGRNREGGHEVSGPMKNVAVLLAGGVGVRVGLDVPKQLIKIAGHPIMEHTLGILDRHEDVDEIVVMMTPGPPGRRPRDGQERRLRQGHPDPRGRRHPQRHHPAGTREPRRRRVQGAAARRGTPSGQRPDHRRLLRRARHLRRRRRGHPVGRHDHRGRRRTTRSATSRRAATCAAARRRRPSRRRSSGPPTPGRARTPTSRRPTTARWCCATAPTCRSGSSPATSAT